MEKITEQCDEYDLNFLREAAKLLSTSPLSKGGIFSCSFAFFPVDQDTPIFSSSFLYIFFKMAGLCIPYGGNYYKYIPLLVDVELLLLLLF